MTQTVTENLISKMVRADYAMLLNQFIPQSKKEKELKFMFNALHRISGDRVFATNGKQAVIIYDKEVWSTLPEGSYQIAKTDINKKSGLATLILKPLIGIKVPDIDQINPRLTSKMGNILIEDDVLRITSCVLEVTELTKRAVQYPVFESMITSYPEKWEVHIESIHLENPEKPVIFKIKNPNQGYDITAIVCPYRRREKECN